MDTKHGLLNRGLVYSAPGESLISMWRRFLVANKVYNKRKLDNLINFNPIEHPIRSVFDFVLELNFENLCEVPLYLTIFQFDNWELEHSETPLHCPKCAEIGFHTDVFRLEWIKRCPIHGEPLSSLCPLCKKTWPNWLELLTRECACCGRNIKPIKYRENANSNFTSPVCEILEFISYNNYFDSVLVSSYTGNFENRRNIGFKGIRFPSFQRLIYPQPIDFLLQKSGVKLFSAKSIYKSHSISKRWNSVAPTYDLIQSRYRAIRRIDDGIKKAISEKHTLKLYDLPTMSSSDLSAHPRPCVYCLAFSLWFYAITKFPYSPHSYNFENLNGFGIDTIPVPYNTVFYRSTLLNIPVQASEELYYLDLISYFSIVLAKVLGYYRNEPQNRYWISGWSERYSIYVPKLTFKWYSNSRL